MAVQIITTVTAPAVAVAPAGPYDLTTLANVHDELQLASGDTTKDSFLSRAITQISMAIADYCGRVFAVEGVTDLAYIDQDPYPWQTPGGVRPLQLSRWPLANSAAVPFTGATTAGSAAITGVASTAGLAAGMPVFGAGIPAGATIQSVSGSTVTLTLAATTTGAGVAFTTGVQVVQTLASGLTQTLVAGTDFTVDANLGQVLRLNPFTGIQDTWEALPTAVSYAAGYATVPADLEMAALVMVTARYKARGRDPSLMQTSDSKVGDQRFWVGAPPGQIGAFPPEIQALLDQKYRVPTVV